MADLKNHIHNCLSSALSAAKEIDVAMCRFPNNHAAHMNLNDALHNVLVIAEECRQALRPHPSPDQPNSAEE